MLKKDFSPSAIIFDLGAVLFHWNPHQVITHLHSQDPLFPSSFPNLSKDPFWIAFDRGEVGLEELSHSYMPYYQPEIIKKFVEASLLALTPLQPGWQLVQAAHAKGYPLYLLSNLSHTFKQFILNRYEELFSCFEGLFFSCDYGLAKPELAIYDTFLKKYHLNGTDCLFIDDLPVNIEAAEKCGIHGLVYRDPTAIWNTMVEHKWL